VEALRATCEELELSDQQERLIAALLTLANSQRGLRQTESLDLADITRKVVLSRQAEAERQGIRLATALAAPPRRATGAWRKAWSPTSSTTPYGTTCPAATRKSRRP
jgi:hypothetical protein